MKVTPIKTRRIRAGEISLAELLDAELKDMPEDSVLAVTSKIVSLCEGRVVLEGEIDRDELVRQEAERYTDINGYGSRFTITKGTLIRSAGIDESNSGGYYVPWPKDPQQSANQIRDYLKQRFNLKRVGVVITDSTSMPLRRGSSGIFIAHSGFRALNDYVGSEDLFGREIKVSVANVAGGLSAAAVLVMGEGVERTPLCLLEDLPFVKFQDESPGPEELRVVYVPLKEDLFEPFLSALKWQTPTGPGTGEI